MSKFSEVTLLLLIRVWTVACHAPIPFQNYLHVCPARAVRSAKSQSFIQRSQILQRSEIHEVSAGLVSKTQHTNRQVVTEKQTYVSEKSEKSIESQAQQGNGSTQPLLLSDSVQQSRFGKNHLAWLAVVQLREQLGNVSVIWWSLVGTLILTFCVCGVWQTMQPSKDHPLLSSSETQQQQQQQQLTPQQEQTRLLRSKEKRRRLQQQMANKSWWEGGPWDVATHADTSEVGSSEIFPAAQLGPESDERLLLVPLMHSAEKGVADVLDLRLQPKLRVEIQRHEPSDGPRSLEVALRKLREDSRSRAYGKEWRESLLARINVPLCGGRSGWPGGGRVSITRQDGSVFGWLVRTHRGGYKLTPINSQATVLTFAGGLATPGRAVTVSGQQGELFATTEGCDSHRSSMLNRGKSHYLLCIGQHIDPSIVLVGVLAIDALENIEPPAELPASATIA